jgi:hypothetical protein
MMSQRAAGRSAQCAFEPSSDVVQFETMSSLVSGYGILRDCAVSLEPGAAV